VPYQIQQHLTFALLFVTAYEYTARSRGATDALHGTQLQSLALDRELAAAQLQLLQAQVEPHFLFNTLANLRRLVRGSHDTAPEPWAKAFDDWLATTVEKGDAAALARGDVA